MEIAKSAGVGGGGGTEQKAEYLGRSLIEVSVSAGVLMDMAVVVYVRMVEVRGGAYSVLAEHGWWLSSVYWEGIFGRATAEISIAFFSPSYETLPFIGLVLDR